MSLYDEPKPNSPSFRDYMRENNDRYSYMLGAILQRSDMADRFAIYICDIAANVITGRNVSTQINRLYKEAYNEIGYALEAGKYAWWVSRDSIEHNHSNMLTYVRGREIAFKRSMVNHFDWDDSEFIVSVTGGDAVIGTMVAASSKYFSHLEIPVRPALSGFTVFDHWIINGEAIYTPEITVTIADAQNNIVNIELVTKEEYPIFLIKEASETSESNGCAIYNPGNEAVRTDMLFLTNDLSDPFKWQIPAATVAPGESLEFAGRSSSHTSDLMKIRMGFNVRLGRTIYLVNESGELLHWMAVS